MKNNPWNRYGYRRSYEWTSDNELCLHGLYLVDHSLDLTTNDSNGMMMDKNFDSSEFYPESDISALNHLSANYDDLNQNFVEMNNGRAIVYEPVKPPDPFKWYEEALNWEKYYNE